MYHQSPPSRHRHGRRSRQIVPALLAVAIIASSCSSSDAAADDDQVCRVAQRLVDETADGDADGIERQLDRLGDLEGVSDRTDLGELEDLAEIGDEDALDDLADQIDDDFECGVDVPRIVDVVESAPADTVAPPTQPVVTEPEPTAPPVTEPPATEPAATEPPSTEPAATEPPSTEPAATEPPSTEPAATEAPAPRGDGEALAVVEIGADTAIGLDMAEIAQAPTELVAEAGVSSLPIPAGEAIGLEYSIDYTVNDFADAPQYSVLESATFVAATDQTIEEVRDAFSSAIISATGVDYDLSESSASRDETTQRAVDLRPESGSDALRYEVVAAESTESPGLVFIEITASGRRDGELPALTAAAAASLSPATQIGATLGWDLASWSWSPGINQFSGDPITSGRLTWAIGTGTESDVAVRSAELLELIPAPEFDDIESDREFYIVDDNENWSVRHSDAFEGAELRATYSFTA